VGALVTNTRLARADNSQSPLDDAQLRENSEWHHSGWTARIGSSVGYSDIAKERWSTLGAQLGIGYRLGPLAIEGEYENNHLLYYTGLGNKLSGDMKRLGISTRFYFMSLGHLRSKRSHFRFFVDAAVGTQRGTLEGVGFSRPDYGGGMGWLLEHEVGDPGSGVRRIGWHLGWRITGTPRASEAMAFVVCRGKPCPMPLPTSTSTVDIGLALGSSLSLSW